MSGPGGEAVVDRASVTPCYPQPADLQAGYDVAEASRTVEAVAPAGSIATRLRVSIGGRVSP